MQAPSRKRRVSNSGNGPDCPRTPTVLRDLARIETPHVWVASSRREMFYAVTNTVGIRELKRDAARLVRQAARGHSIVVTRYGKPEALLVPAARPAIGESSRQAAEWSNERLAFEQIESSLLARHKGRYVAISGGRVIGSGRNVDTLIRTTWKRLRGRTFFIGRVGEAPDLVELPGFEVL